MLVIWRYFLLFVFFLLFSTKAPAVLIVANFNVSSGQGVEDGGSVRRLVLLLGHDPSTACVQQPVLPIIYWI